MTYPDVPAELYDDYVYPFLAVIEKALKPYVAKSDPIRILTAEFLYARSDMYGQWDGMVEVSPDLCTVKYVLTSRKRFGDLRVEYTLTRTLITSPWTLECEYLVPWSILAGKLKDFEFAQTTLSEAANALLANLPSNAFRPEKKHHEKRTWHQ